MTTTIDDALPVETEALVAEAPAIAVPRARRPRIWLRVLTGFVLGLALCLALSGAALFAADASYEGRVLPGVRVGGTDLSGMDRGQATATLKAALASYGAGRLIVRTTAGDVTVPYADITREARVDEMVDAAMASGRSGTPLERAVGEVRLATAGRTIDPWLTFDEAALKAKVDAGLASLERPPVDSTITMGKKSITVTPSQTGRAFDGTAAIAAAIAALQRTDAPEELVVDATGVTIQPALGLRDTLAAKHAAERMARGVIVTRGSDKWAIKAAVVRSWIHFETQADGSPWPVVDATAISKALADVAKAVKVPAVSATYLKARNGKIVGVTPDKPGHKLDSAAMATQIAKVVQDRAGWIKGSNVKVRLAPVAPKLTTEQASRTAPVMQILGTWKTWFPVNDHNFFGANIWIPAKIINGTVLRPGQRFEWWSAIGPVTPSRGFGPGGFIAGNHTEPTGALGGGMCSSSTTLFNAALRAGLQMGARSNHKYYIYRYPLGLDATVSKTRGGGSQTMSFTNDMKHPVVIRTFRYTAGGRGWVRYEIWGIPDGRTVSLSKPSVSNVRQATTSTVFVSSLKPGVRMQTEYPADGMDVAVSRVVRKGGKVIHSETFRTHYVLWNGRIEVGR
jgi:vancomycin resistance protein YoaR